MYGIDVHCVWVLGLPSGGWKVGTYKRGGGGLVVFASTRGYLVGLVLLGLEPLCFGVPIIDGGGDRVHRINAAHEHRVESF